MIFRRTQKDMSLDPLRRMSPRNNPGFDDLVASHLSIKDTVTSQALGPVAGGADGTGAWPGVAAGPGRSVPRRRVLGLSAAAAVVLVGAAVGATLLFTGGSVSGPTPAYAAEAVQKAAVDTSAAAQSGIIATVLAIGGEPQVGNTFAWNGGNLSLRVGDDPDRELRYVGGMYYETYGYSVPVGPGDAEHQGQWVHCTDYDNGSSPDPGLSAVETPDPVRWLVAARSDLAGSGLVDLVSNAQDYAGVSGEDGSVTYSGTATIAAIQALDLGMNGLPVASQPSFKVRDPSTPITITVVVGPAGLIRELTLVWTFDEPVQNSVWNYTATYSDLGSAAPIVAPDPDHTVTTDNRFGNWRQGTALSDLCDGSAHRAGSSAGAPVGSRFA